MKNILILGGSGFIGRHVCEALERAGLYATVPTRRLPARSVQMLPRVSVVSADVHDPAQLSTLVRASLRQQAGQLHMHMVKALSSAVQDGHQVDHRIVSADQG